MRFSGFINRDKAIVYHPSEKVVDKILDILWAINNYSGFHMRVARRRGLVKLIQMKQSTEKLV